MTRCDSRRPSEPTTADYRSQDKDHWENSRETPSFDLVAFRGYHTARRCTGVRKRRLSGRVCGTTWRGGRASALRCGGSSSRWATSGLPLDKRRARLPLNKGSALSPVGRNARPRQTLLVAPAFTGSNDSPAVGQRSGRWTKIALRLTPSVTALFFGAALFVGVFGLRGGSTGSRSTITQPALVRIISSDERPTDLDFDGLSAATAPSLPSKSAPARVGSRHPLSRRLRRQSPLRAPEMSQSTESNSGQTASVPPEVAARPDSKPAPNRCSAAR